MFLGMKTNNANNEIFNVGTGIPTTIKDIAELITEKINPDLEPIYTQQYRVGDIRHCVADISKIKKKLNFKPKFSIKQGIEEFIDWIKVQNKTKDKAKDAINELVEKGLLK
jgi:dTDP-L-rhamnose 4-epimerase